MKMRLSCLLTFSVLVMAASSTTSAQVQEAWVARYQPATSTYNQAVAVSVDASGAIYVAGSSASPETGYDFVTIKYNANGQQIWAARFNGADSLDDIAVAMTTDVHANVYVTGYSNQGDWNYDIVTIKHDSSGTVLWTAQYNGSANFSDQPYDLAVDDSGNVFVCGEAFITTPYKDMVIIKYNTQGVEQWVRTHSGTGNFQDWASAVATDAQGNVYLTGPSLNSGTSYDYVTIKYDSLGTEQWAAAYNGSSNNTDTPYDLCVDEFANVFVTGASLDTATYYDIATVKYNSAGQQVWVQRYNGAVNSGDQGYAITLSTNNSVIVTGQSYGGLPYENIITLKYSADGVLEWSALYDRYGDNDEGHAVVSDAQGNVYVTGWSEGGNTNEDYTTLKYDPTGNLLWSIQYNGPDSTNDRAAAIALDPSNHPVVTGFDTDTTGYPGLATIKYVPAAVVDPPPPIEPLSFILYPCRPNPFNASTIASFELRVPSYVSLNVYDTAGRLVTMLVDGWRDAGSYVAIFDGSKLSSGIYLAKLEVSGSETTPTTAVQKLVLLK